MEPQQDPEAQSAPESHAAPAEPLPAAQIPLTQEPEQHAPSLLQELPAPVQHGPQSTVCPQLLGCGPHLPEQVFAAGTQQSFLWQTPPGQLVPSPL
jgi:hypothetical protein